MGHHSPQPAVNALLLMLLDLVLELAQLLLRPGVRSLIQTIPLNFSEMIIERAII